MELTDWLLIAVLWFQVANLLYQLWPKLSRLRHRNQIRIADSMPGKKEKKDAYETLFGGEKE